MNLNRSSGPPDVRNGWMLRCSWQTALRMEPDTCTHLGKAGKLPQVARRGDALDERPSEPAQHSCDSACYYCLKEYRKLAYHGLLDWRLAGDLLDLLQGREPGLLNRLESAGSGALCSLGRRNEDGRDRALRDSSHGRPDGTRALVSLHPFEVSPKQAGESTTA